MGNWLKFLVCKNFVQNYSKNIKFYVLNSKNSKKYIVLCVKNIPLVVKICILANKNFWLYNKKTNKVSYLVWQNITKLYII